MKVFRVLLAAWFAVEALTTLARANEAMAEGVTRRVAICPWQVGPTAEEVAGLVRELGQSVGAQVLEAVPGEDVQRALGAKTCEGAADSLAPLAVKTGAAYGLHGRIENQNGKLVITWLLVSRTGQLTAPEPLTRTFDVPLRGKSLREAVEKALPRFYAEAVVPVVRPVPVKDVGKDEADPSGPALAPTEVKVSVPTLVKEPSVVTPSTSPTTLQWVGIGSAALGFASLVTSEVVAITAQSHRERLKVQLDENGQMPETDENRRLADSLNRQGTLATATLVGGSLLVATGAVMFFMAPKASGPSQVGVSVAPGRAAVMFQGSF